jgi:hypothetical protein
MNPYSVRQETINIPKGALDGGIAIDRLMRGAITRLGQKLGASRYRTRIQPLRAGGLKVTIHEVQHSDLSKLIRGVLNGQPDELEIQEICVFGDRYTLKRWEYGPSVFGVPCWSWAVEAQGGVVLADKVFPILPEDCGGVDKASGIPLCRVTRLQGHIGPCLPRFAVHEGE